MPNSSLLAPAAQKARRYPPRWLPGAKLGSAKTAQQMEIYAGIYIIAFDLILAIELIKSDGLEFRFN